MSRKISRAVAHIHLGLQETLYLGNLDARRDWGHAKDYVEGMWRILQHDHADDFVLATGKNYSVRDFVNAAFAEIGISICWQGTGIDEVGIDDANGKVRIKIDPRYFRPIEVDFLQGKATKAKTILGWEATVQFNVLVVEMVQADIAIIGKLFVIYFSESTGGKIAHCTVSGGIFAPVSQLTAKAGLYSTELY